MAVADELFYVTHVTKVSGADVGCLAKEGNSSSRSLPLGNKSWWLVFQEGGTAEGSGAPKTAEARADGTVRRAPGPVSCAVHARGLGSGGSAWFVHTLQALSCSFLPVTSLLGTPRLSKNDLHR